MRELQLPSAHALQVAHPIKHPRPHIPVPIVVVESVGAGAHLVEVESHDLAARTGDEF